MFEIAERLILRLGQCSEQDQRRNRQWCLLIASLRKNLTCEREFREKNVMSAPV
jgi:hypothetical protein